MPHETVFWPVLVTTALMLLSALVLGLANWPRRKSATLAGKVAMIAAGLVLFVAGLYFWGYHLFYGGD